MIYEYLLLALLIINLFPWHKILTHLCSDEKLIIPSSLIIGLVVPLHNFSLWAGHEKVFW